MKNIQFVGEKKTTKKTASIKFGTWIICDMVISYWKIQM